MRHRGMARHGSGRGGDRRWRLARDLVAALAVLTLGSCGGSLSAADAGGSASDRRCGDGVCSSGESATSCPGDCVPRVRCGDGVCAPAETCQSCPADCEAACLVACPAVDRHTLVPASIRDTTSADPASADQATCGDGAVGPLRRYLLSELPPGRYRVSATGAFDIVVDARHLPCDGDELGCEAASAGSPATFALTLARPETLIVEVAGLAGEGGDFSLDITPEPLCGDAICQDETCLSCAADCGVCPVQRRGDGTCQVTETCESCGRTAATVAPGAGTGSAG